jgi:hypothetical protein
MKKLFDEFKVFFEGLFLFVFVTEATTGFLANPSFLTFPDFYFGLVAYFLYRLTVNLVTNNLEKLDKAKRKKEKLEKRKLKKNGKKGP